MPGAWKVTAVPLTYASIPLVNLVGVPLLGAFFVNVMDVNVQPVKVFIV